MNTLNALPFVVIMSACKGENYQDDVTNNVELHRILWNMKAHGPDIEFKAVTGYYKGTREASYMITFMDASLVDTFITLGEWFKQECILVREFMPNGLPVVNLYFMDYDNTVQGYINRDWHKETIGHTFKAVCDARYTNDPLPEACTIINFKCWVVC